MNNIWILAQAAEQAPSSGITSEPVTAEQTSTKTTASDTNAPAAPIPTQKPIFHPIFLFGLMLILFYFIIFRGPRKKQQEHKKMVQALERNDRVRTIGGIIGTVVDIKDDEITLKVDEANNTKIKIAPSAIGKNLSKDKT
jgi:preprotein translocase subunit YajC